MFAATQKYFLPFWIVLGMTAAILQNPSLEDDSLKISFAENPYRMTRFGWQDSRLWTPIEQLFRESPIHPGLVSALFILGVVGVYLWSSEEDEVARLFGNQND